MIQAVLLMSRQGKVRLVKFYNILAAKERARILKEIAGTVATRSTRLCNFLEFKDQKLIFKRYASLFFVLVCDRDDNELLMLEFIQHLVETLDGYFGNVCELDLIFNFQKAYYILDELLLSGEIQESSKRTALRLIEQQETMVDSATDVDTGAKTVPPPITSVN